MLQLMMGVGCFELMPVIRFVREGRDVECYPGENLREVARREGISAAFPGPNPAGTYRRGE